MYEIKKINFWHEIRDNISNKFTKIENRNIIDDKSYVEFGGDHYVMSVYS